MDLRNNDDVKAFGVTNGYGVQYNDILLNWLRDFYSVTYSTLPDLLARYVSENGYTLQTAGPTGEGILLETGTDFLLAENDNFLIQE